MPTGALARVAFRSVMLTVLVTGCGRARPETHGSAQSVPMRAGSSPPAEPLQARPTTLHEGDRKKQADGSQLPRPEAQKRFVGYADLDPDNDFTVGPPDDVPDCEAELERANIKYKKASLPLRQPRQGVFTCGTAQAIAYLEGPGKIRYNSPPVVSCGMALALGRFEEVLQEETRAVLDRSVTRIVQLGTYSCRKMARFPSLVSEHSYANAIDIQSLLLNDGQRISVRRHFGSLTKMPDEPKSRFLRGLAHRLYDEALFSVVLTPFFDQNHADHFHLDLARYRVDGTR